MPRRGGEGWTAGGATVVQVVTDDQPFLVDSLTMEVLRQGWSVREVFHPQYLVRRDAEGALVSVERGEAADEPGVLAESWMHLEILPPTRPEDPDALVPDLERGLRDVLGLVRAAVEDWQPMKQRCAETAALLGDPSRTAGRADEAALAQELLGWLDDNHFTFLGYREHVVVGEGAETRFEVVPGTGLGVLRGDDDVPGAFHALPQPGTHHLLMIITKDDERSRVHRPAYLDYLGVRTFDADGRVVGERRFLGLFASSAYSESIARVPVLRQKTEAVLRLTGYDEQSHGGKAVVDVLESYPRDELFQTPVEELAGTVEKIAHLKERRQVRMFVRPDPYGRYLSCLVYLPRDRYTTAVRRRMEDLLLRQLGGVGVDYSARVTESVLARLHFVLRRSASRPLGEIDVRGLEKELTLATRSWDDAFADLVTASEPAERLSQLARALPESYKEDYAPAQALDDLTALSALTERDGMSLAVHRPVRADDEADLRLKIFRRDASMSLSTILPHLTRLGVDVIDERPYELTLRGDRAFVYDFGLSVPGGRDAVRRDWTPEARERFTAAFAASYSGRSESDAFNALVLAAGLDWSQVSILRAVGRYLQQAGSPYSQAYLASALGANTDLARRLVALFETRFDPALGPVEGGRAARVEELTAELGAGLDDVASLDHDRIVRSYLAVLGATLRTNHYVPGRQALALKLAPRQIPDLPEPRPAVRDLRLLPALRGRAPALRCRRPRRSALVRPRRGLPHRGPRPGQGADGQEHRDRPGGRQGRLLRQAAARPPGRPGCLAGRGDRLLPALHHQPAGPDRQPRRGPDRPPAARRALRRRRPLPRRRGRQGDRHLLRHRQRHLGGVGLLAGRRLRLGWLGGLRPQGDGHHRPRGLGVGHPALPGAGAGPDRRGLHLRGHRRHERRRLRQRHAAEPPHPAGGRVRPPARVPRPRPRPCPELRRAGAAVRPAPLQLGRLRPRRCSATAAASTPGP